MLNVIKEIKGFLSKEYTPLVTVERELMINKHEPVIRETTIEHIFINTKRNRERKREREVRCGGYR